MSKFECGWPLGFVHSCKEIFAMFRFTKLGFGICASGFLIWIAGCYSDTPTTATPSSNSSDRAATDLPRTTPEESEPTGPPTEGSPEGEVDASAVQEEFDQAMTSEIEASFAALSVEDREKATKQRICPISEEPLGSMGTPLKVAVAGHEVFICCEGCEQPLKNDPTTHLAKIGLKPVAPE
jgi:hypothetical protein